MTSTGTPHVPLRSRWPALLVTVTARAVLVVLVSLLGWSLVPAALGWQPTVVMTGSMQPELVPGDVVVSRPIGASQLALGQVLLVDNPDQPGELRLHRLIGFDTHGELVTRGDANRSADSTPVAHSAVHGVGALHIPCLGLPYLWASDGQTRPLILAGLALLVLIGLAVLWRPVEADDTDDESPDGFEPAAGAAQPTPLVEEAVRGAPHAVARCLAVVTLVVGIAIAASVGVADAATKFATKRANPADTWAASSWFSCVNAVKGDDAAFALPLSDSSTTTASDVSGNGADGTYSGGFTHGVTGPCLHDGRTAVTLNGTSGKVTESTAPPLGEFSCAIWFQTSGAHGGMLISMANAGGQQTKVALALTSTGSLVFAVGSSSMSVTTPARYNDNTWHFALATSDSSGIALYVDGQNVAGRSGQPNVSGQNGTVSIGYGNHSTLGTGSNDYFQGRVAFAAGYLGVLSAGDVSAQYAAAL